MQIDLNNFWNYDFKTLIEEYKDEDEKEYESLLRKYIPAFDEITEKGVVDSILIQLPKSDIKFLIRVYKSSANYKPYFIFTLEQINPNIIKPIPIIRTLSKLCVYISQLPLTNASNLSISSDET